MKNLFQTDAVDEVVARIDKLQPTSPRQWGKMDVAQMLAHCTATMDMACGQLNRPRVFVGYILGPFVKPMLTNDKPLSRNSPTDEKLKISDARDFIQEQKQLKERIRQFHDVGEVQCTKHPHPFFGRLTAQEWATGMYKHLDHHMRQFGV
jgi:hypothetical protein